MSVGNTNISFRSNGNNVLDDFYRRKQEIAGSKKSVQNTKDPYMQYPVRALAYLNEVGVALKPTLGSVKALGFWVPALAYFGADINDKYKKGTKEKAKDWRPATSNAVFHAIASIVGPTAVIHYAQKWAMKLGGAEWVNKTHDKIVKGQSGLAKIIKNIPFIGKKLIENFKNTDRLTMDKASTGIMKQIDKLPFIGTNVEKEFRHLKELGIKTNGAKNLANRYKTVIGLVALALAAIPIDILTEKFNHKIVNRALKLDDHKYGHAVAARKLES